MLPNDNVSMSVGHLDHVLIVYSSMEHMTWKVSHHRPCCGREPCAIVLDWDKEKVVNREAQRQTRWIKEVLWIRKTPMCMNRDAGSYNSATHGTM